MASRTHIRRSYDQRRRTHLQPGAVSSIFRRRSILNAVNDVSDGLDKSAVHEMTRRRSFPASIKDMDGITRNTSIVYRRGPSTPSQKFSCTLLTHANNINHKDTLMPGVINNRFRNVCLCMTGLFLVVFLLSLYRLMR
ncbi:hypothetical protein ACJMK2_043381 [Sinanodonta woodiana]|uniref:Uncharacterized protein n=1 Tax=Sinanodonta woodiana TaxID=1069815 RepID=A0ABD3VXG9_SINWO